MNILTSDIVSFILRHRKKDAFLDWEPWQIDIEVSEAIGRNCICVDATALTNQILGVIIGRPYPKEKLVHVSFVLAVSRTSMFRFGQWFRETYGNDWKISAYRHGKFVEYGPQTSKLLNSFKAN